MAILTHMCPHCLTDHVGLRMVAFTHIYDQTHTVHLVCPKCKLPGGATVDRRPGAIATDFPELLQSEDEIIFHGWELGGF
ncbi:MAG: hypothetical protein USCAAHI_01713 [Beijerinckiaceae bacterium]|nr:MAG: hypothetical protein USCAAHI_01713 [Beijerinckiaceae bacterium]